LLPFDVQTTMIKTLVKVGPADHGKRMSLEDFDKAETQEGFLYELSRGIITVSDVPKRRHLAQIQALRRQISGYDLTHPGLIDPIAAGSECKILLTELESERHPDIAINKTSSALHDEETLWATWIPDVGVEVVSPGSEHRDYVEKKEEYFLFGVTEYWIVDFAQVKLTVLQRHGSRWREEEIRPPARYTSRVLPGFTLDIAAVFEAANQVPE
jgi:Uma2 family endonuclease